MDIITKVAENNVGKIKIHGIPTGKLAIKESVLNSKKPGTLSTLLSFRDKRFGEWLPIWSWLIEHPEGVFLIDTGLSTDVKQTDYFKKLSFLPRYYFEKQMRFEIEEEEEINHQLSKIGFECNAVDKIILTHLHIDHTGGLKYFANTPIVVNDREWKTKDGSFPQLFPKDIQIESIKLNNTYKNFAHCAYLTNTEDLMMVETPGHTRGHSSIILKMSEDKLLFFGGDVAYNQNRLVNKLFSATIQSHKKNVMSCNNVMNLASQKSLIFLPTHDFESGNRLMNEVTLNR